MCISHREQPCHSDISITIPVPDAGTGKDLTKCVTQNITLLQYIFLRIITLCLHMSQIQ